MIRIYEGPRIETKRYGVPGIAHAYVELRQSNGINYPLGYTVEHGGEFGHKGSWGRDNYQDARQCANEAWTRLAQLGAELAAEAAAARTPAAPARAAAPAKVTEDGMYKTPDGTIYKVQRNRERTNLYAKRLVVLGPGEDSATVEFVYAPGALRTLTADMRLSLEDAKAFGALYGTCCVCGRTLTNETSIEAGIGPICAGRL